MTFVAAKPSSPQFAFQELLMAAETSASGAGYHGNQIYGLQSNVDNFRIILQFCGDIRWNHII